MRHKLFGFAIAAIAAFGPMQAWGGDQEIAQQIIQRLQNKRSSGDLKNFTLDMKVDKGVVVFRGKVNGEDQKNLVLKSAKGIDGIANVVDELTVKSHEPEVVAKAEPTGSVSDAGFSLREALADQARQIMAEDVKPVSGVVELAASPIGVVKTATPDEVKPAAAVELAAPVRSADQKIVAGVVGALSRAQKTGKLKGFGVDVKSNDGVVWLKGRAASLAQRNRILQTAEAIPGVKRVRNSIRIPEQDVAAKLPLLPSPPALTPAPAPVPKAVAPAPVPKAVAPAPVAQAPQPQAIVQAQPVSSRLSPVAVQPVPAPVRQSHVTPAATVAAPIAVQVPAQPAPYRTPSHMAHQPLQAHPVQAIVGAPSGAPYMGSPVGLPSPIGAYSGGGAPRYDAPNLPNYAWPGYAASNNYAALTYPQQYSPSAWPYIGPFYPYPQVPLGWRKVSLEWDDGWWQLDFTDR